MKEEKILDISWSSIFKISFFFFILLIVYHIKEILVLVLFALIISILFEPAISFLEERKINRFISVPFIYFSFFFLLGLLFFFLSAPIVSEIQNFAKFIPEYFEKISPSLKKLGIEVLENFENLTKSFQEWLIKASASIFSAITLIFGGIFSTLTIFSFSFFLSLEGKSLEKLVEIFFSKRKEKILEAWKRCQKKISIWFGVKILGCLLVGILTFLTLKVIKANYAFSLSLLVGFLNLIPFLGPIFGGALIAIFLAFSSLSKAIFFILAFILIQLIEGNIFLPILTERFIKISPFLVLFSLLAGGKLLGFWGALLSIPLIAILIEFSKEFLSQEKL